MRRTRKAKCKRMVSGELAEGSWLGAAEDRLEDWRSELFWMDCVEDKRSWDSVTSLLAGSWLVIELVMICAIFVVLGEAGKRLGLTVTDSRSWRNTSSYPTAGGLWGLSPVWGWRLSCHWACTAGRTVDLPSSPLTKTPGLRLQIFIMKVFTQVPS